VLLYFRLQTIPKLAVTLKSNSGIWERKAGNLKGAFSRCVT
jgi:hypothetical protein